jgi:outer membrane immunogenic protein
LVVKGIAIGIAAAAALIGTPASAASSPPASVAPWGGWYIGLNAGGSWGNDSGISNNVTSIFCNSGLAGCPGGGPLGTGPGFGIATAEAVPSNFDSKLSGFIGGGQIGYNWQTAVAVWGLEADFQGAAIKGTATAANTALARNAIASEFVTVAGTGGQKLDFLGTLRG